MKPRLLAVIAFSGVAMAWYSFPSNSGFYPAQQENQPSTYVRTFPLFIDHNSDSFPLHVHAMTGHVVFSWSGESNVQLSEFRIASFASDTNWSTAAGISSIANFRGTLTSRPDSSSYGFVVYGPATVTTISKSVAASSARAESAKNDFAAAEVVETTLSSRSCQNSTSIQSNICVGHVSRTKALKPSSDGGGSLVAVMTSVPLTPANAIGSQGRWSIPVRHGSGRFSQC